MTKYLSISLALILFFVFELKAQSTNLEVDGIAVIDGRLELNADGNSVFIGESSGFMDDGTDNENVFVGYRSGFFNVAGSENTFIGRSSGFSNDDGNNNTFIGRSSGYHNTAGLSNTCVGSFSGFFNSTGLYNTFIGNLSGLNNDTGTRNTYVGRSSGYLNSTGNFNTFLGMQAGNNNTTGSNNIILGYNADGSSSTVSNEITLGNTAITTLRCNPSTITSLSDRRDKTDIKELAEGINFINNLKPVSFIWNQRDTGRVDIPAVGFIAQDLLDLQQNSQIGEYLDLVSDDNPEKLEARYGNLLPVIVKGMQDQQEIIEYQNNLIESQNTRISELELLVQEIIKEMQQSTEGK